MLKVVKTEKVFKEMERIYDRLIRALDNNDVCTIKLTKEDDSTLIVNVDIERK